MPNAHSPKSLRAFRRNRFRSRSLGAVAATAVTAGLADSAATAVTAGLADSATAAIISDLISTYSPNDSLFLNALAAGEVETHVGMGGDDLSLKAPADMGSSSTVEYSIFTIDVGGMDTDFLTLPASWT